MEAILKLINRRHPLKKWSERKSMAMKAKSLENIMKILEFLTGNDVKSMMRSLLSNKHYNTFINSSKERKALKEIIKHLNKRIKPKNKHFYLKSLRRHFSKKHCKTLGFKFSRHLWRSCLNSKERDPGGAPRIPDFLTESIFHHLEEQSEISSSRTTSFFQKRPLMNKANGVKVKIQGPLPTEIKFYENTRFLKDTSNEIYKKFPLREKKPNGSNVPSRSTFYNYFKLFKKFKRQRHLADLC
jgi:hypothetical protein